MKQEHRKELTKAGDRPLVYGAIAGSQKSRDLRRVRRRTLDRLGIHSVRDLTGEQRLFLDLFCHAMRVVERIDPIDSRGESTGSAATYNAALTRSQKSLEGLISSLGRTRGRTDQRAILDDLARYRRGS